MKFRIATYNVENLFRRVKVLNLQDHEKATALLEKIKKLNALLLQPTYSAQTREKIYLLTKELSGYVEIRQDSGSLGKYGKKNNETEKEPAGLVIADSCEGRSSWLGEIELTVDTFPTQQRNNTAKVITSMNADILCLVEVEGMNVLRSFNSQALRTKKYKQFAMIDSPNDLRGIDVACMTRGRITGLRTHVFDAGVEFNPVFSRDCLEAAIELEGLSQPIYVLCNHFKSQSGRDQEERDKGARKRKEQTARVIEILKTYNLKKDWVVVLGDLNEDPTSEYRSLDAMFQVPDLFSTVDPALPATERYTYFYGGGKKGQRLNQLDYIFLSRPLHQAVVDKGFERRGIFGIDVDAPKEGAAPVKLLPKVTSWDLTASDHAGMWVEIDI